MRWDSPVSDWAQDALEQIARERRRIGNLMARATEQEKLWDRVERLAWWERFVKFEQREPGE
jgi:hypothetical protein